MTAARNRPAASRARVWLAAGLVVLGAQGCVSAPPPRVVAPPSAQLTIANLSDYSWRVILHPGAPGRERALRIAPRETVAVEIAAGRCAIEQAIDADAAGPARRFEAEFAAGESYEWALATVRSVAPAP